MGGSSTASLALTPHRGDTATSTTSGSAHEREKGREKERERERHVGLRLQVVLLTLYPEALTHVLTTLSDAALRVRTVLREEVTPPPPLHPLPLGHRLDLPPSRGGGSVGLGPSPSAIEEGGEGPAVGLRVVQQTINVSCAALSLFVTKVGRRRPESS